MLSFANLPAPPAWLSSTEDLGQRLNTSQHAERWKYTRPDSVLDMLSHPGADAVGDDLPAGIERNTRSREDGSSPQFQFAFTQCAPEACSLLYYQPELQILDARGSIDTPLILRHQGPALPTVLTVAPHTTLELQEVCEGQHGGQQALWLQLGENSRVIHSRNSFDTAAHWQYLFVHLDRDARYDLHNHATGSTMHRQDIHVICAGAGSHAQISGAAFVETGQHLDQQVTVEHTAHNSSSEQAYHNIVQDNAKVTFNGRIHIHANCPGVSADLSNKNLALGDAATINTKPELEIYTDDVKCSHGATVGRLDDAHLFYCESRGIPMTQAKQLLSQAFLNTRTGGPLAEEASARFRAAFQGG